MGPRTAEFEAAFAEHLGAKHAVARVELHRGPAPGLPRGGGRPRRRGDRALVHLRGNRGGGPLLRRDAGFADIVGLEDPGIDPAEVEALITDRTKAVACVHFAGYPAAADRLAELCDRHGLALIEDVAHAPSATLDGRKLGTIGLAGAFSFFSNKVLAIGEGGLLATDDDDVAALARSRRSHAMTSGTWDRHSGRTDTYDVTGLGFNYRLDEPRSALALSRLARARAGHRDAAGGWCARYRERLGGLDGLLAPLHATRTWPPRPAT